MKYKKLTKEQILISLDRLTRFKNTNEKYLRVYTDILLSSLIEPKPRKTDILGMDYVELTLIACEILNASICDIAQNSDSNMYINNILYNYENSVFSNDKETQKLINNNILYNSALQFIPDDCPVNLKWLCALNKYPGMGLKELREKYALKYPIEKIVLAEGITEEILLPAFSRFLGFDFYKSGIQIIAAGGKNQVVKMYYKLIEEVKLPIFILLDRDAEENIRQIEPKLRKIDRIHLVSCGEFEDLLPKSLIVKTVNNHFENFLTISESDLESLVPTALVLDELFKNKGLHEFKKAEFSKLVRENINSESDVSDEIRNIVSELIALN